MLVTPFKQAGMCVGGGGGVKTTVSTFKYLLGPVSFDYFPYIKT